MYLFRRLAQGPGEYKTETRKRDIYLLHFYLSTQYLIPNHGPNFTKAAY